MCRGYIPADLPRQGGHLGGQVDLLGLSRSVIFYRFK
jgi:hypothetical protein